MGRPPEPRASDRRSARALTLAAAGALLAAVAWADWRTGFELELFVLYLAPIALVSWRASRGWGVAFALAAAVCWYGSDLLSGHPYSRAWLAYWAAATRLVAFLGTALAVAAIRAALARERRLVGDLSETLAQVRQLEGLIPVCAYCRRIRDDQGYWDRFEAYLSTRTRATFTHGICPTCFERLGRDPGDGGADPASGG